MVTQQVALRTDVRSDSLGQTLMLHLAPGLVSFVIFFGLTLLFQQLRLPTMLANAIALLATFSLMAAFLLTQNRQATGRLGLDIVKSYRTPMPWWQHLLFFGLLFGWGLAAFILLGPLTQLLETRLFGFVPDWLHAEEIAQNRALYSLPVRALAWGSFSIAYLVGAVVEELYFRGYLLSRMERFGPWAPLLHSVLFGLYHVDILWSAPVIVVYIIPMAYSVWWKRNVGIGIAYHLAINIVGALLFIPTCFGS